MQTIKPNKRIVFSILILLSTSEAWRIVTRNDMNVIQKIIFTCLNLLYLFMLSEFIEVYCYHNILKKGFMCKIISPTWLYKMFYIFFPIYSLVVYVLAWQFFITESEITVQIVGITIIMSASFLSFSIILRNNIVFANNDRVFLYNRSIPFNCVLEKNLISKKGRSANIQEVILVLNSGETCNINIDTKLLDEFLNRIR